MNKKEQNRVSKKKYLDSHIQSMKIKIDNENIEDRGLISFGSKIPTTPSSKRSSNEIEANKFTSNKHKKVELKSPTNISKGIV